MWNKLSPKYRFMMLVAGFVLSLLVGYLLSISKTITLWQDNKALASIAVDDEELLMVQIAEATKQRKEIDSLIAQYNNHQNHVAISGELLQIANRHQLAVVNLVEKEDGAHYELVLGGEYKGFVKYLRAIESQLIGAQVLSVTVFLEKDRRTKKEVLLMQMTIKMKQA